MQLELLAFQSRTRAAPLNICTDSKMTSNRKSINMKEYRFGIVGELNAVSHTFIPNNTFLESILRFYQPCGMQLYTMNSITV